MPKRFGPDLPTRISPLREPGAPPREAERPEPSHPPPRRRRHGSEAPTRLSSRGDLTPASPPPAAEPPPRPRRHDAAQIARAVVATRISRPADLTSPTAPATLATPTDEELAPAPTRRGWNPRADEELAPTPTRRSPNPRVAEPPATPAPPSSPAVGRSLAEQAAELRPRRSPTPPPAGPASSTVRRLFHSVVTAIPRAVRSLSTVEIAPLPAALPRPGDELYRELRTTAILDGLPNHELQAALAAGEIGLLAAGRDDLIDPAGRALVVRGGQLALGRFAPDKLAVERQAQAARQPGDKKAEKREHKRRLEVGPLIRLAERNLGFFEEGDLLDLRETSDGSRPFALYATTPLRAVTLDRRCLERWQRSHPFLTDRFRRASQAARQRLDAACGAREEVADFFIRHGLSVSQVARVRKIDACIECRACEAACEERYGVPRLSLDGRVLGGLDFVDACHTCFDQRCIDPCAFDAIKYDPERREVVILEEACTGCTLCAPACPYDAIEMHDLDDAPALRRRLDGEGKLAFGPEQPPLETPWGEIPRRKAKLKRIASKCDHCVTYADQACISACPTGALFDIDPVEVFQPRPEAEAARAGFDHSVVVDIKSILDPEIVKGGPRQGRWADFDRARAVRPRIWVPWMWAAGLLAWLLCLGEIALRRLAPELSVDFLHQTLVEGLEAEIARERVDYRPGGSYAVWLGAIGSAILFSTLFYPARRRLGGLRKVGALRSWFDLHVLAGSLGPLFVLLHTAGKLDNWVSLAFWSMVGTSLSGLAGRYLTTQLPEKASSAVLDALELDRRLAGLRARHAPVLSADVWYTGYQRRVAEVAGRSVPYILGWLLVDDLRRLLRRQGLRAAVDLRVDAAVRRQALVYTASLALHERRRVLLPCLEPLFRRWKLVHVPLAIALSGLAAIHILLALLAD